MNVASANTVGYSPTAFMATKPSGSGGLGVGSRGASEPESDETASPLRGRYPVVALSFDQNASHLVMLFRDPTTGDAVAQIPSKVVVRQYEAAQAEKKRDERRELELVVGGDLKQGGAATGDKSTAAATGETPSIGASFAAAAAKATAAATATATATAAVAATAAPSGGETGGYTSTGGSTGVSTGGSSGGGASSGGTTGPAPAPVAGGSSGFSGRASLSLVV
jgi:hypothetical protein